MDVLVWLLIGLFVYFLLRNPTRKRHIEETRSPTTPPMPKHPGGDATTSNRAGSLPPAKTIVIHQEQERLRLSPGQPPADTPPAPAGTGIFHVTYLTDGAGRPVGSEDRDAWLHARRHGVTATDLKKIVKLNGDPSKQRPALMQQKLTGEEGPRFAAFQHGIEREPVIAAWVAEEFGVLPNSFICVGSNARHLATPDGIGPDAVAEIKTSVKPLGATLSLYRDQLQWQLHVTRSERALFVVENRYSFEREHRWIYRDEARIGVLRNHADRFIEELDRVRDSFRATGAPVNTSAFPVAELAEPSFATVVPRQAEEHLGLPATSVLSEAVDSEDPKAVGDEDEHRHWTSSEKSRLAFLYREGVPLYDLGNIVGATDRAVVFELTRLLLNSEAPLVDPSAEHFGTAWSSEDISNLADAYYDGVWLPSVALELGRDQLGVAFRLFECRLPTVGHFAEDLAWLDVPSEITRKLPTRVVDSHQSPAFAVTNQAQAALLKRSKTTSSVRSTGARHPQPVRDEDEGRWWTASETSRLLVLYDEGATLDDLASDFAATPLAVVFELARRLLNTEGPLKDSTMKKSGRSWTEDDVRKLESAYYDGVWLPSVARQFRRDQLEVAAKLIECRLPSVQSPWRDR
ncbi:YqaJ viral recombinase family protein [Pseudarthrobacter sp. 1C304]|uniref:YqaJ viral recombinase family protein n=1 Tax=Pseudarthrobacter sp. 1C304 TaxID=3457438 RepID=UPI003FD0BFE3